MRAFCAADQQTGSQITNDYNLSSFYENFLMTAKQ